MRRLSVVLLSMVLVGLFGQRAAAQEAVGRVQVFETGQPAADARVVLFDLEDLNRSFAGFTDADGQFRIVLDGRGASGGGGFRLLQNFPNPFNPGTAIPYELTQAGAVRLEVYNILGQQVRVLVDEAQGVGRYTAQWDARDGQGRGVAAGLYLYRLTVDGISDTRQMVLLDGASSVSGGGGGFPAGVSEPVPGPARAYGVSISGAGIETYVQAEVRVGTGTAPLVFAVQQANPGAAKQAAAQRILGDVNNDGRVNISDALIVATYGLDNAITIPNNGDISLGDVNKDGRVNISDALIIATYSIDPTNSSLPAGIGQPVGGVIQFSRISPDRGAPGTLVELSGSFSEDVVYLVRFGSVSLPVLSVGANKITTVVPALNAGPVDVRIVSVDGSGSTPQSFTVVQMASPRVPAAQMQQVVKNMGSTFTGGITALTQSGSIYSGANAQALNREMQKLDAAWSKVGERIASLTPDEYALLANLMDNAGLLTIFQHLAQADFASKQAPSEFDRHRFLLQLDTFSFLVGNVNAALGPLKIAAWVIPGGQPVAVVLGVIKTIGGMTKDVLDSVIPTDLEQIQAVVDRDTIVVGNTAQARYTGEFRSQSNPVIGIVRTFITGTLEIVGLNHLPGAETLFTFITEEVVGLLLDAGIHATDAVSAQALSSLRKTETGVPLDMSLYRVDVISLLRVIMPTLPAADISNFLEKAGVDLSSVTFFNPIESQSTSVASYTLSSGQVRGVGAGTTRLSATGYKFRPWESRFNIVGIEVPAKVGPFYSQNFTVTAPTFSIAGRVTSGGAGLSGVTVTLSGAASRTTTTNSSGDYTFTGLANGTYTVRPSRSGYTFSQASQSITISSANRTGINFTGTASTFPNLLADQLTHTPATVAANVPTTFRVRVANIGTGTASNARVVLLVNGQERSGLNVTIGANQEAWIEFDPVTFGAGSHTVEVVADPNNVLADPDRSNNRVTRTLSVGAQTQSANSLVFILDLSGSMNDRIPSSTQTRLDAAKAAIVQVLGNAASDGSREYALVTFGGTCRVEVKVPFTTSPQTVVTAVSGLSATGQTPLGEGLRVGQHLALDAASSNNVQLVLLSDGVETCGGNPLAIAQAIGEGRRAKLTMQARVISLNVIGMGLQPGGAEEQQIQAIAQAAKGNYFRTSETTDLALALGQASGLQTRVPTLSGTVTDAQGNPVQGAQVLLRNMRENTDANGRYRFPNTGGVQGVDSLIVIATGFARFATEVFLFDADKVYDVRLTPAGSSGGGGGQTLTANLPNGATMAFVYIPAGTFTMGSPSNEVGSDSDEGPQHEVRISKGFYLGKYEVTQGQWEAVMGTRPWQGQDNVQSNANHPAVYVSWNDAQAFVQKLNEVAGRTLYRLPTESEWEYACRAGTTTRWSFGDDESKLRDYAWYRDNTWGVGLQYAQPVGRKLPNAWGLYDMHGNVWEWVQDWYGSYTSSAKVDPAGPSGGSSRVVRDGGVNDLAQYTRSANRYFYSPSNRISVLGFRLLRIE